PAAPTNVSFWASLPITVVLMPGTFFPARAPLNTIVNGPPSRPSTVILPDSVGKPGVGPIEDRLFCNCTAVGETPGTNVNSDEALVPLKLSCTVPPGVPLKVNV